MIITEIKPGAAGLAGGNLPDQKALERLANLVGSKQLVDIKGLDLVIDEFTKTTTWLHEKDRRRFQEFTTSLLRIVFDNLVKLHDKEALLAKIKADQDYQTCVQYELADPDLLERDLLRIELGLLSALYHSVIND